MAYRIAIALAAALLCACGSSAARSTPGSSSTTSTGRPPATPACGPPAAVTLAAGPQARVYALGGQVLGCARGSGRVFRLGRRDTCMRATYIAPVAVSGTLAAYGAESCGVDTGDSQVVVRRLSDGRVLVNRPATTTFLGVEAYVSVSALVLARGGAVAWISVGGSIVRHRRIIEVHALDRSGARRLDAGSSIAPSVLELSGLTVRWRDGGRWRSAQLR